MGEQYHGQCQDANDKGVLLAAMVSVGSTIDCMILMGQCLCRVQARVARAANMHRKSLQALQDMVSAKMFLGLNSWAARTAAVHGTLMAGTGH